MEVENQTATDACVETETGTYDVNLHVLSLFSVLFWSALGVFLPIIAKRSFSSAVKADHIGFIVGKFFGGGVMLSTAFLHIMPEAVGNLTNECLPEFFHTTYPAFAYLLTMLSALVLHLLEWITVRVNLPASFKAKLRGAAAKEEKEDMEHCVDPEGHGHGHGHGHAHAHRDHDSIDLQVAIKSTVSTLTLEAAVGIHSVIIGLTLGVATTEFTALWIALIFHQFFEGIGIGFRIAEAKNYSKKAAFINGGVFSLTTPIGVAIGIGVSVTASSSGTRAVIAEGVFEAIAAGLLIYTALVSLTVEEFGTSEFHKLTKMKRIAAFTAFYLGIAGMALVAVWA